jgi:type I restriction-modification system DNA methylase subunit
MSLFQKSVINKYLKNLDDDKVSNAFNNFKKFYGNKIRLHNIMQLKEENYQEGFLREIFVETLGYTINPDENYNLTTEYKNQKDSRKADGAILQNGKAIGVIELKSTKTKNLESIKEQAFSYKNNQPGCRYVITSNFQSLRFYIDDATEYEEFNLFELATSKDLPKQFKLLYLLLSKNSIFSNLPLKLKEETKFHENNISDKLYKDYKRFKDRIFESLVKNNPQYDKLTLFKKSQKLLDRFLFVLFAEDSGLIPPNAVSKIIEQWKQLQELDEYKPLYTRFQKLFSHLDKGHKYKEWGEIPAYNGGLFRNDEILDSTDVKIDDEVLLENSQKLSAYDFNTEVDVNILGHIFEHSLNEIEEIAAELQGEETDKKKSKRKKDGIFYTPKYITKYIVENTVGKLCKEKKEELQISTLLIDDSYNKKNGKLSKKGKQLFNTLNNYKDWLLTLKILDPACGSGAFLNQTLDFLIAEHKQADDIIAELTGEAIRLFDTDKAILENNIYGVDINEESVEIAKLSLWLRTAQRGRPLSDLSGNIKCGNSLIDDPEVAGDKAFDWEKEFPHVFNPNIKEKNYQKAPEIKPDYTKLIKEKTKEAEKLAKKAVEISKQVYEYAEKIEHVNELRQKYGIQEKGGFDVVLGNPPYVRSRGLMQESEKIYFVNNYKTASYQLDLYKLFIEKSLNLINRKGKLSFITPSVFLSNDYDKPLRKFILDNYNLVQISTSDKDVFTDASVKTIVFTIDKDTENQEIKFFRIIKGVFSQTKSISKNVFINQGYTINENINLNSLTILNKLQDCQKLDDFFIVKNGIKVRKDLLYSSQLDTNYKSFLLGKNINLFSIQFNNTYIHYLPENEKLFTNQAFRTKDIFEQEKLIVRQILGKRIVTTFDNENYYTDQTTYVINKKENNFKLMFLLSVINSKLMYYYFKNTFSDNKVTFPKVKRSQILEFPIKNTENQQPFIEKADQMLSLNKNLQIKSEKFIKRIKANFDVEKITNKLQNFYDFDFKTLIAELKKQKVTLNLQQQDEWEDYFDSYKQEINNLQQQITQTDKEIDKMVYELYELTEGEIEIIENSIK